MTEPMQDQADQSTSSWSGMGQSFVDWLKRPKGVIVVAILAILVLSTTVVPLAFFASYNGTRNQGIDKENQLTAVYNDLQANLNNYLSTAHEQVGIVQGQTAAFDQIFLDAVAGRYDNGSSASAAVDGGSFVSAVVEAYPDLSPVGNSFDRLLDTVSAGRTAFRNGQADLIDKIRSYNTWREQGVFHSWMVRMVGFPSSRIKVETTNPDTGVRTVLTGSEALDIMDNVIQSGGTQGAFDSGVLEPQDFFPTSPPTTIG